jgi:hypothetical protein
MKCPHCEKEIVGGMAESCRDVWFEVPFLEGRGVSIISHRDGFVCPHCSEPVQVLFEPTLVKYAPRDLPGGRG